MALSFDDLVLVSVDDHMVEPPDLFERHVPAKYRDRAPRVEERKGAQVWVFEGKVSPNIGLAGDISILTVGANRYFRGHRIKLTGDVGYAFDAVPVTTRYSGFREDVPFAEGQVVVRVQLQILF